MKSIRDITHNLMYPPINSLRKNFNGRSNYNIISLNKLGIHCKSYIAQNFTRKILKSVGSIYCVYLSLNYTLQFR